jgi:hypothetical protein
VDGYRCDVVALRDEEVQLAIEVMYTHATTDAKTAGLSMTMVELEAFDVLSDPFQWHPIHPVWPAASQLVNSELGFRHPGT